MSTYNYETAYPLNVSAGSTEKPLSACQKIKAEFERIYRLLNSSFADVDDLIATVRSEMDSLRSSVNTAVANMNTLASTLRAEMTALASTLRSEMNTKADKASEVGTYTNVSSNSGTASKNGFIIIWFDNSGSSTGQLKINGTTVGNYTGDGTYGGAVVTGTFPIKKGQSWTWTDTNSALRKIMFVSIGD